MPDESFDIPDKTGNGGPSSQLDIYDFALQPTTLHQFLQKAKMGFGNYSDREFWQLIQDFERGEYASAAFGRKLTERAKLETQLFLAENGVSEYNEDDNTILEATPYPEDDQEMRFSAYENASGKNGRMSKREYGEYIWDKLTAEQRQTFLERISGLGETWVPPHWSMLLSKVEASKGRHAKQIEALFGVRKEQITHHSGEPPEDFRVPGRMQ